MSEYFVRLNRYVPINRPARWVGSFPTRQKAEEEIQRVSSSGTVELVEGDRLPCDLENSLNVEIFPHIVAKRQGLRSHIYGDKKDNLIGPKIPNTIDEIDPIIIEKIKENHSASKNYTTKENGKVEVEENKQ